MSKTVLGVDIGGTNLRSGFVDEGCNLSHFRITPSQAIRGVNAPQNLAMHLRQAMKDSGIKPDAVSIGFPSTLDRARKRLLSTPNLEGLDNIDMVDRLESLLGLPVYIDRDVNMLFLYDCYANRLDEPVMIGCYIGTGLGNVIAINGEILIGKNGVAAELGHIPVRGLHESCPCGNVGCVEMIASGKALCALQEKYYPGQSIGDLFAKHGSEAPMVAFIDDLALPIATEINILDPDVVLLGGGVMQMLNFPTDALEAAIRTHTRKPYPEKSLRFCYSIQRQENGVIGAGIRAFKAMNAR